MEKKKKHNRYHLQLFWLVNFLFLLLLLCFTGYQYFIEKQHKIELIENKLETYNDLINLHIKKGENIETIIDKNISRTTLLDTNGNVLFDSDIEQIKDLESHLNRKEIALANKVGKGYVVSRKSETTGLRYFYCATRYPDYIIRSAMLYNLSLISMLKVDNGFFFVSLLIFIAFSFIFYKVISLLGKNISHLKDFAQKAEQEEISSYPSDFPDNELGEISSNIVQLYAKLKQTKEALKAEQIKILAQQEEQAMIKRQLTENIAHELKTPVASIHGYLETILSNPDLSKEEKTVFLQKCHKQSSRLSALLTDISFLTRIDEAPELIQKEKLNISKIIAEILTEVSLQLQNKKMNVVNNTENKLLEIQGNSSLIYSIFRNLIDNSIAYAGENKTIFIDCYSQNDDTYFFSYGDNGIGVEKEHLRRIFERFYRIDKGRSRKAGGTGLGLSVVKNAVLFHQGNIEAQNRNNGGIEFIFSLKK